jgi:hypothetical protein
LGLIYHKQKDYDNAIKALRITEAGKKPAISPPASLYIGLILMEKKQYKEAQEAFQTVLDTSEDPKLDESAELYIESILGILKFEEEKSRKFRVAGNLGLNYDSNVTLASDTALDAGTATDTEGYHFLTQGTFEYRPVYSEHHEFSAQIDVMNMYTTDTAFDYQQDLRNTDPMIVTFSLPYKYKGTLAGKGFTSGISPGYESLTMSVENDTPKPILTAYFLNVNNTFIASDTWFPSLNLELRQETSHLSSSTGDNDSSAMKMKFAFSNMFFVNKEKDKIVIADVAQTLNNASGKNSKYDRTDLSVMYMAPTVWKMTYNARFAYYLQNYPQKADTRQDNDYSFSVGLSKPIDDIFSAGLTATYQINQSNVEANQYKKYSIGPTLSANYRF